MDPSEQIRSYWDRDALAYDRDPGHHPTAPLELAAWRGALAELLPAPPARVLDAGAGTGFLTLLAASLGHRVTALDLSAGMLEQLRAKAAAASLEVEVVQADALEAPDGPFDAVISRHLLWTLPQPEAALRRWHQVAPSGRLVLVDSTWGGTDLGSRLRHWAQTGLARARREPPAHHAPYPPEVRAHLPLAHSFRPELLLELVSRAGWSAPEVHRLGDVEWAETRRLPWPDRQLARPGRFALVAR